MVRSYNTWAYLDGQLRNGRHGTIKANRPYRERDLNHSTVQGEKRRIICRRLRKGAYKQTNVTFHRDNWLSYADFCAFQKIVHATKERK
jgi:hypothetical protein